MKTWGEEHEVRIGIDSEILLTGTDSGISLERTKRFHSLDRHSFIIDFVVLVFKLSVWVLL